jgi:hypothetical protein
MATLDDLLNHIFDGKTPELYAEFEGWVRGSRRFRAFATDHRDKMRSKLKNLRDDSSMKDLRAELETAALLLHEERFTLEYEKYAASKQRGPDFTVTFKTHTPFNVEVRRLRSVELEDESAEAHTGKLIRVLCDKVGQMPSGIVNLLWLTAEREISETNLTNAAVTLRQRAEHKDEDFFTRRGFESAAGFLKQYRQLSGIVLRQSGETVLWLNSLARYKVLPEILNAIQRLKSG